MQHVHSERRPLRWRLAALGVMFLGFCAGCGGGGGSSPTEPSFRSCVFPEPPPNFPDRAASLAPTTAAPANSIVLRQGMNCADLLVLEVFANGVSDLARVRYTIGFPNDVLGFDNSQLGPFMTENGSVQVTGSFGPTGDLQRPPGQAGVSGSGRISLIAWVYRGPTGSFDITLEGQTFDANGEEILDTAFVGGTLTIN